MQLHIRQWIYVQYEAWQTFSRKKTDELLYSRGNFKYFSHNEGRTVSYWKFPDIAIERI